jgi:hypothetical protein
LTTLFGNTAVPVTAPKPVKKNFWLPLLIVLFLLSYGMMTLLIIEQGATIESQRLLIQELFRDSTELSAVKNRQATAQADSTHPAQTQAQSAQASSTQVPLAKKTPSTQNPSTQVPLTQTPSAQAPATHAPQHRSQSKSAPAQKPLVEAPSRPASDLADERRALFTI